MSAPSARCRVLTGSYRRAREAIDLGANALGRLAGRSPASLELLRHTPLPGKRQVARRIPLGRLPDHARIRSAGVIFDLELNDDLDRLLYFNAYEHADLRVARRHAPAGGVCLDVGANMGVYTLHLARRVGPMGQIHSFEPNPLAYARLVEHCALNDVLHRVHLNQVALSDRRGEAVLYGQQGQPAYGTLSDFGKEWSHQDAVQTATLDEYLDHHGLTSVDLIKVDVEGHEFQVLAGAQAALASQVFRSVLIEYNGGRLAQEGHTLEELLGLLAQFGYAPVEHNLVLLGLLRTRVIEPRDVCVNFLFQPRGGPSPS